MKNYFAKIKLLSLAELIDDGPALDPVAEAIYDLETAFEKCCSVAGFMEICQSLDLDLRHLNEALHGKVEALKEAEQDCGALMLTVKRLS